jgi:hypothetical protein
VHCRPLPSSRCAVVLSFLDFLYDDDCRDHRRQRANYDERTVSAAPAAVSAPASTSRMAAATSAGAARQAESLGRLGFLCVERIDAFGGRGTTYVE